MEFFSDNSTNVAEVVGKSFVRLQSVVCQCLGLGAAEMCPCLGSDSAWTVWLASRQRRELIDSCDVLTPRFFTERYAASGWDCCVLVGWGVPPRFAADWGESV